MGESAWVDTDAALVALFDAQLGQASAYTTLQINYAAALIGMDVTDWDTWATEGKLPAIIVQGRFTRPQQREHGTMFTSPLHIAKEYQYIIGAVVEGDRQTAEQYAKILVKRIEKVVLTEKKVNVTDSNGEQVQRIQLEGPTGIHPFRKADSDNRWYAVGAVGLIAKTTT